MKLEVGKTYKARNGDIVTIVKNDGSLIWPFIGQSSGDGEFWNEDGLFGLPWDENPRDLIEEVTPTPANPS